MVKEKITKEHMPMLAQFGLDALNCGDMAVLHFQKDEYILEQGYESPYVFLILEGKMKVYITAPDGRTLMYSYSTTDNLIGEVEFATDTDTAASSIQAISDVSCIAIPRSRYQEQMRQSIRFMNVVCRTLAQKLYYANENNTVSILNRLETRLCAYIYMTQNGGFFKATLTEIAEVLGTSYRHLLRTLDKLCREGILEKKRGGYEIIDQAALRSKGSRCEKHET